LRLELQRIMSCFESTHTVLNTIGSPVPKDILRLDVAWQCYTLFFEPSI
jgi:hypothetical protein